MSLTLSTASPRVPRRSNSKCGWDTLSVPTVGGERQYLWFGILRVQKTTVLTVTTIIIPTEVAVVVLVVLTVIFFQSCILDLPGLQRSESFRGTGRCQKLGRGRKNVQKTFLKNVLKRPDASLEVEY